MTRILLLSLAAALAAAPALAQQRTLDLEEFDSIDIAGAFDVLIEVGGETRVTIEGEPGDVEDIEISSEGGVLEAEQDWNFLGRNTDLDVVLRIATPSLAGLEAARGADVRLTGFEAEGFDLEVSTGAHVEAAGSCGRLSAEISTGGVLDARALKCREVSVEASTGGVAELYAGESLQGEASTGGEVEVYGAPATFSADTSLGGDISLADGEG